MNKKSSRAKKPTQTELEAKQAELEKLLKQQQELVNELKSAQEAKLKEHEQLQQQLRDEINQQRAKLEQDGRNLPSPAENKNEVKALTTNTELYALRSKLDSDRDKRAEERDVEVANFEAAGTLSLEDWFALLERADPHASDAKRTRSATKRIKDGRVLGRILASDSSSGMTWASFKRVAAGLTSSTSSLQQEWDMLDQGRLDVEAYFLHFQSVLRRCQGQLSGLQ